MSNAPLADDWEPTYTHFSHKTEFLDSLREFVTLDIGKESTEKEDEDEDALVTCLGAVVSQLVVNLHHLTPVVAGLLFANARLTRPVARRDCSAAHATSGEELAHNCGRRQLYF